MDKPGTAPGTGLESPETGSRNRRSRALQPPAETAPGYLNRGNARKMRAIPQRLANAGSYRSAWWWTRSDANPSPQPKFPNNREKYREFCKIWLLIGHFRVRSTSKCNGLQWNSLRMGTGNFPTRIRENFSKEQEIQAPEQGIRSRPNIWPSPGRHPTFTPCPCRTSSQYCRI